MNKLEDSIYQAIGLSANEQGIINQALATNKTAEITTDVAVKFAQWIDNSSFTYYDEEDIWSSITTEEKKTNEALFQEFINNHYTK